MSSSSDSSAARSGAGRLRRLQCFALFACPALIVAQTCTDTDLTLCMAGQWCNQGQCDASPSCTADADCPGAGETCAEGHCGFQMEAHSFHAALSGMHNESQCPAGTAVCPASSVVCVGTPTAPVGPPTCEGTTADGYDCQALFDFAKRQDNTTCPDECFYTNDHPTCGAGWIDDVVLRGRYPVANRPFRVCDYPGVDPQHDCAASCAPGCELRWDAPAHGAVGICVPLMARPTGSCTGTATDQTATPDCAMEFSAAGGTAAFDCAAGCAYVPAVVSETCLDVSRCTGTAIPSCTGSATDTSLTCDLEAATDSTASCPAGCTGAPTCDADPATDGTADCPAGCTVLSIPAMDCSSFVAGMPSSCPVGCAYAGPACAVDSCPGFASATEYTYDGDDPSRVGGHTVCSRISTCGDMDGDTSTTSTGEHSFYAEVGCAAGAEIIPATLGLSSISCGPGGCDRATCCVAPTGQSISAAVSADCPTRVSDLQAHTDAIVNTCTGTATPSCAGTPTAAMMTCDLDAATDGTASCPAGCTGAPTCDLDAATDSTADCPAGCTTVGGLGLAKVDTWMLVAPELQGLLICLMAQHERDALCERAGMGGFDRSVIQEFCPSQATDGNARCPAAEHHHCCSCFSDDYPLQPDNGHCCADCATTCATAVSSLPTGDVCLGISGTCDPILLMDALADILATEAPPDTAATPPTPEVYGSALMLLTPDKLAAFCACRGVGSKLELQGGDAHNETAAVVGDNCLPDDHLAGTDTWVAEAGPCTTGSFIHMNALGLVGNIPSLSGYPSGVDCRWSISCPDGAGPVVKFLGADGLQLNAHSLGPAPDNMDPYTELEISGSCGPADPSVEDFNNALLYGPAALGAHGWIPSDRSVSGYPQIVWEVEASHAAATRAGVVVDSVRTLTTWEHITYHREGWVNTGVCTGQNLGDLSAGASCQEMIGTFFECEAACSANPDCGAFSRDSTKAEAEADLCSLVRDASGANDGGTSSLVTFLKQHTIIPPGVWTKQTGRSGESVWDHENACAAAAWGKSRYGFEIEITCVNSVAPPFGPYDLSFEHLAYACKPFEGRGDFVRLYDGRTVGDNMVGMVADCTAAPTVVVAAVHTCTGTAQSAGATGPVPICDLDSATDPSFGAHCPFGCTEVNTPTTYSCSAAGCEVRADYAVCAPTPFNCTAPDPSVRQQGMDYSVCDSDALDRSPEMCHNPILGCVSVAVASAAACIALHSGEHGVCPSYQLAAHTCFGTPTDGTLTCDLDADIDGTASCPAGCMEDNTPEYRCDLHQHDAACVPMDAMFTGTMAEVAANGGAPLNSPFAATGPTLLMVATARGSDATRRTAQLECVNSYRAGQSAALPGSCGAGCVLVSTPGATGAMAESCAVIGNGVGGFNATFTCEALAIDTSWLAADQLARYQTACPTQIQACLASRDCAAELYPARFGDSHLAGTSAEMQALIACMASQSAGCTGDWDCTGAGETCVGGSCGVESGGGGDGTGGTGGTGGGDGSGR